MLGKGKRRETGGKGKHGGTGISGMWWESPAELGWGTNNGHAEGIPGERKQQVDNI